MRKGTGQKLCERGRNQRALVSSSPFRAAGDRAAAAAAAPLARRGSLSFCFVALLLKRTSRALDADLARLDLDRHIAGDLKRPGRRDQAHGGVFFCFALRSLSLQAKEIE